MKENIYVVLILLAMVLVCALMYIGLSENIEFESFKLPKINTFDSNDEKDKINKDNSNEENINSNEASNSKNETTIKNNSLKNNYETIYNEYSTRLKNECPTLSITECAEISNEGVSEMAKYMYRASGTDGQYATYEQWASKLMDVYLKEAR